MRLFVLKKKSHKITLFDLSLAPFPISYLVLGFTSSKEPSKESLERKNKEKKREMKEK